MARIKAAAARFWPVLRLRSVLLGTLLFVAALPGVSAVLLRVYENALVRRTEAELIAQGAALAASAALIWPGATAAAPPQDLAEAQFEYTDVPTGIDLRSSPVLPERPAATLTKALAAPDAMQAAQQLAPVFAETKQATLASILLLDRQGIVLNGRDKGLSLAALPEVQTALAGRTATTLRHNDLYAQSSPLDWLSRATSIRLHHARPVLIAGKPVAVLLVSRSPRALFRGMWEDRGKIAAGVVAIFAALLVLTAVLARAIVRPIENLSKATKALAAGQITAPVRPSLQVVEIRSLFDDFAVMAQSIARRSRYLRDFAASLSHEFKTPLAGIRGGIELLQDHGETMATAERERFLANMAQDAERLNRLVSRLMVLAQADMQGGDPHASAQLTPIAAQLADGLSRADFTIAVSLPAKLPELAIDAAALEAVLATLIENSAQAGAGEVTITASVVGSEAVIELADNGPGIPPADRERVFDPFFTSKREAGGTGLGLAIARALVENSRGHLALAETDQGATFRLTLPLARV